MSLQAFGIVWEGSGSERLNFNASGSTWRRLYRLNLHFLLCLTPNSGDSQAPARVAATCDRLAGYGIEETVGDESVPRHRTLRF